MSPYKQLMDFIKNEEMNIVFRWITKDTLALIEPQKEKISLNIYLMLANCFIHEFMHDRYSLLNEKEVCEKTNRFIRRMTVAEIKKLGKYLLKTIPREK